MKDDFACVIFNLRTPHNEECIKRTTDTFRELIDAAEGMGGSFFVAARGFRFIEMELTCELKEVSDAPDGENLVMSGR